MNGSIMLVAHDLNAAQYAAVAYNVEDFTPNSTVINDTVSPTLKAGLLLLSRSLASVVPA